MADKHIRLNSRLSAIAAFWKPDSPDEVTTGNLTVDDNGIHFVTSPKYTAGSEAGRPTFDVIDFSSIPKTAVLHGFFEEGNCTLLHLMVVKYPGLTSCMENPQSIVSTDYHAAALISGMHMGGYEENCIDSARFTFSSLAEWLIMPLNEEWGEKYITIKVPAEEIELLDVCLVPSRSRIELKVQHG